MPDFTMSQVVGLIDAACWLPTETSNMLKYAKLNKVRELFYNSNGLWKGLDVNVALKVYTGPADANGRTQQFLTLPFGVGAILGLYDNTSTIDIANEWFDYLHSAPGASSGGKGVVDMGDGFCGVVDPPATGAYLSLTTTAAEPGSLSATFYGMDVNGNAIHETLAIPATVGSVQSSNVFCSVTEVVLPVTAGNITVRLYDGVSYTFFASYRPGETYPNYRRYRLSYTERSATVNAKCKRAFEMLTHDNDPCDISNIGGLEHGLRAYKWFQNNDYQHGDVALQMAINLLNGELKRQQGDTAQGSISIDPLLGLGACDNVF